MRKIEREKTILVFIKWRENKEKFDENMFSHWELTDVSMHMRAFSSVYLRRAIETHIIIDDCDANETYDHAEKMLN